eukprot:TRINITY_DN14881_c0_g1_i1.p1 TRINITY_DN14881_c0_g1~~TRINITY_DN14881_c0_g1_i1.p1  ORF type:complete len:265 (-),score=28.74 TRINITY_DN14881_c0_g1_i1:167-961(-)
MFTTATSSCDISEFSFFPFSDGALAVTPRRHLPDISPFARNQTTSDSAVHSERSDLRQTMESPRATTIERGSGFDCISSPPHPPRAPTRVRKPPLLKALEAGSVTRVAQALDADPEAALFPFMDHDVEPVLCAGVRSEFCTQEMVDLLVERGCDVNARDVLGRTPLALLCLYSCPQPAWSKPSPSTKSSLMMGSFMLDSKAEILMQYEESRRNRDRVLGVAEALLAAGAETQCVDGQCCAEELARASNNYFLEKFIVRRRTLST